MLIKQHLPCFYRSKVVYDFTNVSLRYFAPFYFHQR